MGPTKNRPLLYNRPVRRLHFQKRPGREAASVVKGTNRRVIVVKSPDPRIFDEAIFVIREDYMARGGTMEQLMEEARQAAGDYLRRHTPPRRKRLGSCATFGAAAAALAGIAWAAMRFVGV